MAKDEMQWITIISSQVKKNSKDFSEYEQSHKFKKQ
jgi:hypothetical protein